MANAIFLANPDLNIDDIVVTHSSALGRRAGTPIPAAGNSGLMVITAIGDAGDGLDHIVEIKGQDKFPRYNPKDDAGTDRQCSPESFSTLTTATVIGTEGIALVEGYDRLHLLTLSATSELGIYIWDGTAFTLRASQTLDQDVGGGFAACTRGDNIYIGVVDPTNNDVDFYSFNCKSFAIRDIVEGGLSVNGPGALAMASDGAMFVVLHEYDLGSDFDVRVAYGGDLSRLKQKANSFLDMFGPTWAAATSVKKPAICWNSEYRFVAVLRSNETMRVAHSFDGDDWLEFTNIVGAVSHPAGTTFDGAKHMAIAPEGRRLFTFRADGGAIKQSYFVGRRVWNADLTASAAAPAADPAVAACNWRGTIYMAYPTSATTVVVRRCNELTTSATGHSRAMELGRRNYVDGPEDDTRTALFFTPRGAVNKGDTFTIPTAYDHRGANVLSEILGETWRSEDQTEQYIYFDAGVNRKFVADSIAIFGSNLPTLTLELDDEATFTSPPVSVSLNSTLKTATIVSADANRLVCAADSFLPHEFASRFTWAKFTTGISGIFRVLDNTTTDLVFDGDVTGASGTVTLFGDRFEHRFSGIQTPYRFWRLKTATDALPDAYNEIARVIFGLRFESRTCFEVGYGYEHSQATSELELKTGSLIVTKLNQRTRRHWDVTFDFYENAHVDELIGFFARFADGAGQLVMWPMLQFSDLTHDEVLMVRVRNEFETPGSESIYTKARIRLDEEI